MTANIEFSGVSKKYRLGMSRTSIPALISSWARTAFRGAEVQDETLRTLWALRDVSFELQRGNSLALVGANGAGKTTILKLIAQVTKPTTGTIKVNGRLSALIELGAGFHPDLSGRDNIYLNGTILGLKRDEIRRRFDSIVDFSELGRFIDTPVKRYSSGMAVRLGFAVAASIDPENLLVDEVLAVGDTTFRLKCMNRIQELIKKGTTLIFVSHNMGLVKAVCNTGLYIEKGVSKYYGPIGEAIEAYNRDLNQRRMTQGKAEDHTGTSGRAGIFAISSIEIKNPINESADNLKTSQPARISIRYHAHDPIPQVSVVLRIVRSDGTMCCSIYSRSDRAEVSIARGYGSIDIEFTPLQLFPGTYYAVATVKSIDDTVPYDMGYTDWFHVEGDAVGYEDMDAVFEPVRSWNSRSITGDNHADELKLSSGPTLDPHESPIRQDDLGDIA